jgi:single-stranded-DNA-specific exonuclease
VTPALCREIAQAGPYGAGNPEPVLVLPAHRLAYAEDVGQAHVRARFRADDGTTLDAIAFRAAGQTLGRTLTDQRGHNMHVAGCLAIDRWQGAERVQFRLVDVASAEPTALR